MKYAPVLIPTLNRYEHLKKCVESLQNNTWAQYTDLYIALDYPAKDSHYDGHKKISDYLDTGITGFKSVTVIKRTQNFGVSGYKSNLSELRNEVKKKYDRIIITEDDNIFSPCFIEYMDRMLELSEQDENIVAVCGYSYPVNWIDGGKGVILEQSFFSAWGCGYLVERDEKIRELYASPYHDSVLRNRVKCNKLWRQSKKNYCYFMDLAWGKNYGLLDISRSCLMTLENLYCLMPTVSLVRNCGWDGSGINCNTNPEGASVYKEQVIQTGRQFNVKIESIDELQHYSKNETIINNYYNVSVVAILRAIIKQIIMTIRILKKDN